MGGNNFNRYAKWAQSLVRKWLAASEGAPQSEFWSTSPKDAHRFNKGLTFCL